MEKLNRPRILKTSPIILALYLTVQTIFSCTAQENPASGIKFSGYVDAYYARYSDSVGSGKLERYGYESPIGNSFGVNLAQLTVADTLSKVRVTITLQAGDMPKAIWSPIYNYIQEANAGIKLCNNVWIDAGFFKSQVGSEYMTSKDNICSFQSIISWTEPFYQSGVRLTYSPGKVFTGSLYVVNGFNQFVATNKKKAVGLQLTDTNDSGKCNITYNNLLSDDTPDTISMSHWRLWNNLVFNDSLSKKWLVQFGLDFITQQNSSIASTETYTSYSTAWGAGAMVTFKYKICKYFSIHARMETLDDPQGLLTGPDNYVANNPQRQLIGETFGVEYSPTKNAYIRLEGRELEMASDEKIFYNNGVSTSNRGELMLNLGVSF